MTQITVKVKAQYFRIFWRHVFRHLRRHPLLAILNILSVALGVSVYLATEIANQSANRSFAATVDLVAGKADLEITSPSGRIPETIFPSIARATGISAATPLVRGLVTLPDFPGEYLEILGVDILTNQPFRTFEPRDFDLGQFDFEGWLGTSDSIAVTEEFARQHQLKPGDKIRVRVNTKDRELKTGFVLRSDGPFDSHFAAMDIGWAQELFGIRGELSAIQLRLTNSRDREKIVVELRKIAPSDASVAAPSRRTEEVNKMLSGFELNLKAMSLLSLAVGMFLIFNTVSASVARRRREIGILRALGVTRNEVRFLFLGEALLLGALGATIGLGGGVLLAKFLGATVAETISSLYVLVDVKQLALGPGTLIAAWIVGITAVFISAWIPADAGAKMEPVTALRGGTFLEKSVNLSPKWVWSAILLLLISGFFSWLALAIGPPWLGILAAFTVLTGFSFFVPWVSHFFSATAAKLFHRQRSLGWKGSLEGELGAANLSRALSRNGITIAALATAVALTVGVSVMVFSFRRTVEAWINDTLIADLFVAPASNEIIGAASVVSPEAIQFLASHPAVETYDTFREAELAMGSATASAAVIRGSPRRRFQFIQGDNNAIMQRFRTEECVIVSESFTRRNKVREGDSVDLTTPDGPRRFPIAGVFYDYSRDRGIIYLSAKTFAHLWHDDRVNSVAVFLKDLSAGETLSREFQQKFSRNGEFIVYPNHSLRRRIFDIFDQTFAVTYVLRTIAVIVAITGIFLSLTILITERSRELAMLRAIGGSAGQVRGILLWETAMIGTLAAVVGLASGVCLALVLTGVINRAFFGWTIQLAIPWRSLLLTPIWIIAAAVIAGIIPAWRAGRLDLAEHLRSE